MMNPPPPSADVTEAVAATATAHQSSPTLEDRARDVAHRNVAAERSGTRASRSPSRTNILDAVATNLGLVDPKEALEAAPATQSLSLRPSPETPSPASAQVSASGDASSIVSKASTLMSQTTDGIAVNAVAAQSVPSNKNIGGAFAKPSMFLF